MLKNRIFFLAFFLIMGASWTNAQEGRKNNLSLFDNDMSWQSSPYRSASGAPGEKYWQNKADYVIRVSLDESTDIVKGDVKITYTNNSPEDLPFVWLHLEQNRFTEDSRGTLTLPLTNNGGRYGGDVDGGHIISNVSVKGTSRRAEAYTPEYLITDTRMQIWLQQPVKANGGSVELSMNFEYKVPKKGADRTSILDTKNGKVYAIAQWYPKMITFDDIKGWNVEPYLGAGEFYLEYGDFNYYITVPYDHIVVGSGDLMNPSEVLPKEILNRYNQSKNNAETVMIIKEEEVGKPEVTRPKQSGTVTWHFRMNNTRDVAWASSKAFIWDGARIDLPSGKKSHAQSVYPLESKGQEAWGRSTEYTKASIEHYSEKWFEYPYPVAVNVASEIGGMEYPGLSFCAWGDTGEALWGVTDHEFGHNWFPMIVGSNERLYPWMDEGFNTFINHYSTQAFNDEEYPATLDRTRNFVFWFNSENREGIDTYPDIVQSNNLGMTAYMKPGMGLILLREYILGHERFDYAFKEYIKRWAYKHPTPQDFFNTMNNVAGDNLDWFWKGWFYGNKNIDISIDQMFSRGTEAYVYLSNKGGVPMPVELEFTYQDDSKETVMLPVEIWHRGNTWVYRHQGTKAVKSVKFDPRGIVPDVNASNDAFPVNIYDN